MCEIAIAFRGLRPEFARHFHDRLHSRPIHFDFVDAVAALLQRAGELLAVKMVVNLAQDAQRVFHRAVFRHAARQPRRRILHESRTACAREAWCTNSSTASSKTLSDSPAVTS